MKCLTIVLSGVGASGFCGIALKEFCEKNNLEPSFIVGSSTSAFIACMWACGLHSSEMLEHSKKLFELYNSKKLDLFTALTFYKAPKSRYNLSKAILKSEHIQNFFADVFGKRNIEDLKIKTFIQTTDVNTSEGHIVKNGSLSKAVYASSALLPFYPAIELNGKWLADGAFSESLPLKAIIDEETKGILALDANIRYVGSHKTFFSLYSSFIQKSSQLASRCHTALIYDLHHDEIFILPVNIQYNSEKDELFDFDDIINLSRNNIYKKSDEILAWLNSAQ